MKLLPSKSMVRGYPVLLPLPGTCDKNAIVDSCVFLVASTFALDQSYSDTDAQNCFSCEYRVIEGASYFCHWLQQFHQTEQSRRHWFSRWCCSVSFATPLPQKQHHHKSSVILWLAFEDRCSRHLLLMPDWAAVLQNWNSRAQTAAFFWSCQFLLNFFFWFLFFRIICCENHIALMYELAIFDLDFLNFSWRKSTGRKLFRFCLTVERKRCRYADLCHIMLWRGVFHVIFFGICFLNKSPYCPNRDYDCYANQNLPFSSFNNPP